MEDKELKILESVKKGLKKQERKISSNRGNASASSSKKQPVPEEIKISKNDAPKEIDILNGFLSYLKKKPKKKHTTPISNEKKFEKKLTSMIKEIKNLEILHKNQGNEKISNYALEHSLAIIGQYVRDMDDIKIEIIQQLGITTLNESFKETKEKRNKFVMHDFVQDHTSEINNVLNFYTGTMVPDLEAIQIILSTDIEKEEKLLKETGIDKFIRDDLGRKLADITNNLGHAYYRVCKYKEAETFFNKALLFFSGKYFFEKIGFNTSHSTIFEILDNQVILEKIVILDNLSKSYIEQKEYTLAKKTLEEIYTLAKSNNLIEHPELSFEWLINYAVILAEIKEFSSAKKILNELLNSEKIKKESQHYIYCVINLAQIFNVQSMSKEGLLLLQKLDSNNIENQYLKFQCFKVMAQLNISRIKNENIIDCKAQKNIGEECLNYMELAKSIIESKESESKIKLEIGEKIVNVKQKFYDESKSLYEHIAIIFNNYAEKIGTPESLSASSLDESIKYLSKTLQLQRAYNVDDSRTLLNIAFAYLKRGQLTKNSYYDYQKIKTINDEIILKSKNIEEIILIKVKYTLGFAYESLQEYNQALKYLQEAKNLYKNKKTNVTLDQQEKQDIEKAISGINKELNLGKSKEREISIYEPTKISSNNIFSKVVDKTKQLQKNDEETIVFQYPNLRIVFKK